MITPPQSDPRIKISVSRLAPLSFIRHADPRASLFQQPAPAPPSPPGSSPQRWLVVNRAPSPADKCQAQHALGAPPEVALGRKCPPAWSPGGRAEAEPSMDSPRPALPIGSDRLVLRRPPQCGNGTQGSALALLGLAWGEGGLTWNPGRPAPGGSWQGRGNKSSPPSTGEPGGHAREGAPTPLSLPLPA